MGRLTVFILTSLRMMGGNDWRETVGGRGLTGSGGMMGRSGARPSGSKSRAMRSEAPAYREISFLGGRRVRAQANL